MAPKNQKKSSKKGKKEKEIPVVEDVAEEEEEVAEKEEVAAESETEEESEKTEEEDAKSEVFEKEDADEEKVEAVKENGLDESSDETKETKKKSKKKKKTKETSKENGDASASDDDEHVGLYDGPVEIFTAKRERKSREFLTFKDEKKIVEEEPDYSKGEGSKIKDIPYAKYQISREDDEDLLTLYQLMYRKQPRYLNDVKRKIYAFQGYPFDDSSKYYKSHQNLCDRLYLAGVRYINELLGLDRKNKTKEEMIGELFEFLKEPKDLGLEVPKAVAVPKGTKKGGKRVNRKRSQRIKGHKEKKIYVDDDDEEESEEEESEEEEDEEEEEEEEVDDGRRKSRRSSSNSKKSPSKKTPAKKGRPSKRRASYPSDDSSDEEVLVKVKKSKKSPAATSKNPPTNPELKKAIVSLLKDADLGSLTMKNILHQIYDKYSVFDLSDRKDFLKKTVKDCL